MGTKLNDLIIEAVGIDTHKALHVAAHTRINGELIQSFSITDIDETEDTFKGIAKSIPFVLEDSNFIGKHLKEKLISLGYTVYHYPSKYTKKSNIKSDIEDARCIALNLMQDITKAKQLHLFDDYFQKVKEKVSRRRQNTKELIAYKNILHAELYKRNANYKKWIGFKDIFCKKGQEKMKYMFSESKEIDDQLIFKTLEKIKVLEEENKLIEKWFKQDTKGYIKALCTIKQVSFNSASLLLAEIGDIKRFKKESSLVRYAGAAPVDNYSSGKVIRRLDTDNNRQLNSVVYGIALRQAIEEKTGTNASDLRKRKRYILRKVYTLLKNVTKRQNTLELPAHKYYD